MSEDEPPSTLGSNLGFISDHPKRALDDMTTITAKIEELKSHDEDWA